MLGITVLELLFAIAIGSVLLVVAVPSYTRYQSRAAIAAAIGDIGKLQLRIGMFELNAGRLPVSLAEARLDALRDPWGRPYVYLNLSTANPGAMRKDRNLVPINSDYDLYSSGKDGRSQPPLTSAASRDDIVRANNGGYIGEAKDY